MSDTTGIVSQAISTASMVAFAVPGGAAVGALGIIGAFAVSLFGGDSKPGPPPPPPVTAKVLNIALDAAVKAIETDVDLSIWENSSQGHKSTIVASHGQLVAKCETVGTILRQDATLEPAKQLQAAGISDLGSFISDYTTIIRPAATQVDTDLRHAIDWFSTDPAAIHNMTSLDKAKFWAACLPVSALGASTELGYIKLELLCRQWAMFNNIALEAGQPPIDMGTNLVAANDEQMKYTMARYQAAIAFYDQVATLQESTRAEQFANHAWSPLTKAERTQMSMASFVEPSALTDAFAKAQTGYEWLQGDGTKLMESITPDQQVRDTWSSSLDAVQTMIKQAATS